MTTHPDVAAVTGSRWKWPLVAVAMTAAVFVIARLTRLFFYDVDLAAAVWWPASGLALAVLVRAPRRWWPALFVALGVGNAAANLLGESIPAAIGFALANMVEAAITASVVSRALGSRATTQRQTGMFLVGAAAAVLAAGLLVMIRCLIDGTPWWPISRAYVLAHAVGLIAVTPLLLPDSVLSHRPSARRVESVLHVVVVGGVAWWAFLAPGAGSRAFLAVMPLIWAARRLGALHTTLTLLALVVTASVGTVRGGGTFAAIDEPLSRLLSVQMFAACISILTLVLVIAEAVHRRLDAELADRTLVLQDTVDAASTGMALVALGADRGSVITSNTSFRRALPQQDSAAVGTLAGLVSADDEPLLLAALLELENGPAQQLTIEVRPRRPACVGTVIRMSLTDTPRRIHGRRAVVTLQDITDQRERETALSLEASTDPLTHLMNRRAIQQEITDRLARRREQPPELAVLFVDLNGFKKVNDTFGHAVGDQVLEETARRLVSAIRPSDAVGRLGGDEFLVVCEGVSGQPAVSTIAARIVAGIGAPMQFGDGVELVVGASVGTALARAGMTVEQLLDTADEQMYRSKPRRGDDAMR